MNLTADFRGATVRAALLTAALVALPIPRARARQFSLDGVALDLQDATTNVDVYCTSLRYNRADDEWDVEVTLSNKTAQALAGPVVLLVDSFTGTSERKPVQRRTDERRPFARTDRRERPPHRGPRHGRLGGSGRAGDCGE